MSISHTGRIIDVFSDYYKSNINVISVYLLCLWPYTWKLLNSHSLIQKVLNVVSGLSVVYVTIQTHSLGCQIAIGLVLLFLLVNRYRFLLKVALGLIVIGGVWMSTLKSEDFIKLEKKMTSSDSIGRSAYTLDSYLLFKKYPLFGVGSGNLPIRAYSNTNLNSEYFINKGSLSSVVQLRDHNIYSRILAEMGAIGLLIFILPFFILIYKKFWSLDKVPLAPFSSLLIYLTTSIFYLSNQSYPYYFSINQCIGIVSLSLCAKHILPIGKYSIKSTYVYMGLSIITITWFFYVSEKFVNFYHWDKSVQTTESKIKNLLGLYNGKFNTIGRNVNQSIEFELAKLYSENVNEHDKAASFYNSAVSNNPNNVELLTSAGDFFLYQLEDYETAEHYYNIGHDLHPLYYPINNRLARFYVEQPNCSKSKNHSDQLFRPWNKHIYHHRIIENMYYTSTCGIKELGITNEVHILNISSIKLESTKHLKYLDSLDQVILPFSADKAKEMEKSILDDELHILTTLSKDQLELFAKKRSHSRSQYLYKSIVSEINLTAAQETEVISEAEKFGKQYLVHLYKRRLCFNKGELLKASAHRSKQIELVAKLKLRLKEILDVNLNEHKLEWLLRNFYY